MGSTLRGAQHRGRSEAGAAIRIRLRLLSGGNDAEVEGHSRTQTNTESESVPEEGASGRGRGGSRGGAIQRARAGNGGQAGEESVPPPQRQAARSGESTALQRHGVVRQPGVHF